MVRLRLINLALFLIAGTLFAYEQYGISILWFFAMGYTTRMIDEEHKRQEDTTP